MTRIAPIPLTDATGETKTLLDGVKAKLGMVPNLYATLAKAPAALAGLLQLTGTLAGGGLGRASAERIALAVGQSNACDYCVSAHTLLGKHAGLSETDMRNARAGKADAAREAAVLAFAEAVVAKRGQVSDAELATARAAGLTEADILEIVGHVALNIFTNYVNNVAQTTIDFPKVDLKLAA